MLRSFVNSIFKDKENNKDDIINNQLDDENESESPKIDKEEIIHPVDDSKDIVSSNYTSNIICGHLCSFCINEERNIFGAGKNDFGKLGDSVNEDIICPPRELDNLYNIKMVGCGNNFTICLDIDGNIFSFGNNEYGQLGVNKDADTLLQTFIPQKVDIPPISYISCGVHFSICLSFDGEMYSFGNNKHGQVGIGTNTNVLSPELIPDLGDIEIIECGGYHSICKTVSGDIFSWGYNLYGELGLGHKISKNKPTLCENSPSDIISIKCGYNHTLLLTLFGQVYSFGGNYSILGNISGQLGNCSKTEKAQPKPQLIKGLPLIKRIACGCEHSLCIDTNDRLWVFGSNKYGQLGVGDYTDRHIPVLNETLKDVFDISHGGYHTFVKLNNNQVFGFGNNTKSQLGFLSTTNQNSPIELFKDLNKIWITDIGRSKQKSARK